MTLGEKLQALRAGAGLSQEDLAERLEVSRQAISKWELDKTVPDVKYIVALSGLFGVTTDYLLKDGGAPTPEHTAAGRESAPEPAGGPFAEPARIRAACILLGCGNMLCLVLLLFYLAEKLLFHHYVNWPLVPILILPPLLTAVCHGLLWRAPLSPTVRCRYRRGVVNGLILMGFALIMPFGFIGVIDDLLISRVEGFMSLPLFTVLLVFFLLLFWGLGRIVAHGLLKSLETA